MKILFKPLNSAGIFFSWISEQKPIKCCVTGDSGTNKLRPLEKAWKIEKFYLDANFIQLLVNSKQWRRAPKALAELNRKKCDDYWQQPWTQEGSSGTSPPYLLYGFKTIFLCFYLEIGEVRWSAKITLLEGGTQECLPPRFVSLPAKA